jgi:purine-nucleoside phosphorylase
MAESTFIPDRCRELHPEWGLVAGSGLAGFVEELDVVETVPYSEFPQLPQPTVPGHAGRFVFANLNGSLIVVAQGRSHLYEGCSAREITAGVRTMHALGVRRLILTNAAGSLHSEWEIGEWMLITDHINFTGTTPLTGAEFVDLTQAYDADLQRDFVQAAGAQGLVLREGVYAGLRGPQYETPAEIRMLGRLGADAVGMSTVLETIQARALGIRVAAFSCLTNLAAGLDAAPLSHEEVIETGRLAAHRFARLIRASIM